MVECLYCANVANGHLPILLTLYISPETGLIYSRSVKDTRSYPYTCLFIYLCWSVNISRSIANLSKCHNSFVIARWITFIIDQFFWLTLFSSFPWPTLFQANFEFGGRLWVLANFLHVSSKKVITMAKNISNDILIVKSKYYS